MGTRAIPRPFTDVSPITEIMKRTKLATDLSDASPREMVDLHDWLATAPAVTEAVPGWAQE